MVTDEDLIAEMRGGSRTAFDTLFGRYREPLWRFFRRRTADPGRAEELAQDTFVAVLAARGPPQGRGTFESALFGVAPHLLPADRRKAPAGATTPIAEEPADPNAGDPDA